MTTAVVVVANRRTDNEQFVTGPLAVMQAGGRVRSGLWVTGVGAQPARDPLPDVDVPAYPVPLTTDEIDYYGGHADAAIWPLYHDAIQDPVFAATGGWPTGRSISGSPTPPPSSPGRGHRLGS